MERICRNAEPTARLLSNFVDQQNMWYNQQKMNFEDPNGKDVHPSVKSLWLRGIWNPMVGLGEIDFTMSEQNWGGRRWAWRGRWMWWWHMANMEECQGGWYGFDTMLKMKQWKQWIGTQWSYFIHERAIIYRPEILQVDIINDSMDWILDPKISPLISPWFSPHHTWYSPRF